MSARERKRASKRAQQAEEILHERQVARIIAESIARGETSALHWHGELPWTEPEHRQLMVAEVEARATGLAAQATDVPWHELPTVDRMRYRSAAYTIARVEVGWGQ